MAAQSLHDWVLVDGRCDNYFSRSVPPVLKINPVLLPDAEILCVLSIRLVARWI